MNAQVHVITRRGQRPLRVLIVIENMSYTFDTRVKNIAQTLERHGCRVWVICPRYPGDPPRRTEGGVRIRYFSLPQFPGGVIGHVLEYLYSFLIIGFDTLRLFARVRFDVIHICNPPDIFFPLGGLYRLLGCRFVFDLHDLCPELWDVRYGKSRVIQSMLLALERSAVAVANHVLTTSETARERICGRAGIDRSRVTLVRNGPDLALFPTPNAVPAAPLAAIEVGYIGHMNPQDCIDGLLLAAKHIRHGLNRTDIRFVLIGDGSAYSELRGQADALGLEATVSFLGRMAPEAAMARLAQCTLCVQPDLKNAFTDGCVMVKSLEYMALGKPMVAFDLKETRRICATSSLFADRNDPCALGDAIVRLADDPQLRQRLGSAGRRRVERSLAWSFSETQLLKAYARLSYAEVSRGFHWYVDRLRSMSPAEVAYRLRVKTRTLRWRRRSEWNAPPALIRSADKWTFQPPAKQAATEVAAVVDEARMYLRAGYKLLNIRFPAPPPNWHRDPQTGIQAPLAFAFDIDYRDPRVAGNIKNIWELNRHRHLVVLAVAHALTGERGFSRAIRSQLLSWCADNPVARGVNWHSPLELALRLIAWVWIERLLRGSDEHADLFGENGLMWPAIYWHQWFIAQLASRGSSANNHLVGEMAGLFMAATVWPYFEESGAWCARARCALEREIGLQTFESGLNREQAFAYHLFSLELFLLAAVEGLRVEAPFTTEYREHLCRMLDVIPKLTDAGGNLPRFGDDDGGTALQLQARSGSRVEWLCRLGSACAGWRVPVRDGSAGILAAALVWPRVAESAEIVAACPSADSLASTSFIDAGLFVLAANRHSPREMFCLADAGPLGFGSIAAHGHADALSFTLSIGGTPIIVDPGTGQYFADAAGRAYFRGTKAHNTVVVDGQDQSRSGGAFLWTRHARARLIDWRPDAGGAEWLAEHDGYSGSSDKVVHRRRLLLSSDTLVITDYLLGTGEHALEWRLHFSPECRVQLVKESCVVQWSTGMLTFDLSPAMRWRLAKGEAEAGWYSPGHNIKVPTVTLIGTVHGALPQTFHHAIHVDHRA